MIVNRAVGNVPGVRPHLGTETTGLGAKLWGDVSPIKEPDVVHITVTVRGVDAHRRDGAQRRADKGQAVEAHLGAGIRRLVHRVDEGLGPALFFNLAFSFCSVLSSLAISGCMPPTYCGQR